MAITIDKLINDERFCADNVLYFLWYLPIGILLLAFRIILALVLWIASIVLPNKSAVRQVLSTLACYTFGVYVKVKGTRDPRCSVLVGNYVSCLDSLAVSHVLGTISLRKWRMPPFFAATLGIKNAAQFVRKEHFSESPSLPVMLQPEGGPTSGGGLLRFSEWPFPIGNRVQPVAITVERVFTKVTVHRAGDSPSAFPWSDALWFLWSPLTAFSVRLLPPAERRGDDDAAFTQRIRTAIADALQVEMTDYTWQELNRGYVPPRRDTSGELTRLARQVKEVLPRVPIRDIMRDLSMTRSVDVTITNFLEGVTPFAPEPELGPAPGPSAAPPRYITPIPTGVFPKSARERQLSFQERKVQMIAEARRRYVDKHGLSVALNNC